MFEIRDCNPVGNLHCSIFYMVIFPLSTSDMHATNNSKNITRPKIWDQNITTANVDCVSRKVVS